MSWRDELLPASFRGAPFYVTSSTASLGRRTITREYPFRDTPVTEDLGRRKRVWRLDLFVIGPNYTADRDALIAAIETAGSGQLILPLQGAVQVVIDGEVELTESNAQGGMATFRATFVEAGELPTLKVAVDTQARVLAAVAAASTAADEKAAAELDTKGQDDYAEQTAKSAAELVAPLSLALQNQLIAPVTATAASLVAWVGATLDEVVATLEPLQAFDVLLQQAGTTTRLETPTTPRRSQQVNNVQNLTWLLQWQALVRACQLASEMAWRDRASALVARARLLDVFDVLSGQVDVITGDSLEADMLQLLQGLRAAVSVDLEQRAMVLPRLVAVSLPAALPGLVVAYNLYNDLSREDELLTRNAVAHPLFMPQDLEVLSV
jgi:prophage DNA circulation protein